MTTKYKLNTGTHRLPRCCGVYEIGDFNTVSTSSEAFETMKKKGHSVYGWMDSKEEAAKFALDVILSERKGHCIQFWFYKSPDYEGCYDGSVYLENTLRHLVKAHPNCVELAEYVNPNSNNMIHGLMIKNELGVVGLPSDRDDDDDED